MTLSSQPFEGCVTGVVPEAELPWHVRPTLTGSIRRSARSEGRSPDERREPGTPAEAVVAADRVGRQGG